MSAERWSILVVDDEAPQAQALCRMLALDGHQTAWVTSGSAALAHLAATPVDIVLSDLRMPGMSGLELHRALVTREIDVGFVIQTAYGTIEQAVTAIREGVYDYVEKPINLDLLQATLTRVGEQVRLRRENRRLRERIAALDRGERIVGDSPGIRLVRERIAQVAATTATVLVRGESGTGKELVAEAIHARSPRAFAPFIKVNCAAIPEGLEESELFGHVRGAFTGAIADRRGRFEQAAGGTIFLDEVGELSLAVQAKLLRVLQEREIEPVGAGATRKVDVRVVAATHRDLAELVKTGEFREDLFYRIDVIAIDLPPLRDRRQDIRLLAELFLAEQTRRIGRTFEGFTREAIERLERYRWPGNIRELHNAIERAAIFARGTSIDAQDLDLERAGITRKASDLIAQILDAGVPLDQLERELLKAALERAEGNQTQAARLLGLTRRTLQYRAEKFGLRSAADSSEEPAP